MQFIKNVNSHLNDEIKWWNKKIQNIPFYVYSNRYKRNGSDDPDLKGYFKLFNQNKETFLTEVYAFWKQNNGTFISKIHCKTRFSILENKIELYSSHTYHTDILGILCTNW